MKISRFFYSLIFFIGYCTIGVAQDESILKPLNRQYYLFSPRVSVTVPHPISNRSFTKSFVGIYEISGGLNLMLYKGLFVGFNYKRGYFQVKENKIPNLNTGMSTDNASIKVGSDFYVNDNNRIILSAAVSAGKNRTHFVNIKCKDSVSHSLMVKNYTTTFIEPEINLFFLVESNFGIGVTLSYTMMNRIFDPYEICLNDWAAFDKNSTGTTQYLSFGFGFYYSFLKKKK